MNEPPKEVGAGPAGPDPDHQRRCGYPTALSHPSSVGRWLRSRRAASYRLPALPCGYRDPWRYQAPGAAGYTEAARHLLDRGLTPAPDLDGLRAMWAAGGHHRAAAELIAQRWELMP